MARIKNRKPAAPAPARWYEIKNQTGTVPTLQIFGDIGVSCEPDEFWGDEGGAGTFKEFCDALNEIGAVPEMRVEIHSCGGSVIVGKAIHDKLVEHPANKTAVVYGICASAATYPALACQKVVMPANSFFLIHNSTGVCMGDADDMEAMSQSLAICDESIANLYAARTGKSLDEILGIMEEDTWMTGTDAVAMGLADEIIDPVTITPAQRTSPDNFRRSALNAAPQDARAWFDTRRTSVAPHFLNYTNPNKNNNAMTEAELKAAELKLAADKAAFEKSQNDAAAAAQKIKDDAQAAADKIIADAKLAAEPPKNVVTLESLAAENKAQAEELKNIKLKLEQGVVPGNLPGAPPVGNIAQPGQPGTDNTMTRAAWNALSVKDRNTFIKNGGKLTD